MTVPAGVSLAFGAGALAASPTWTRIDTLAHVERIHIKRGRPDEKQKTGVGTATISGADLTGIIDPTNATGTYYSNINPTKQASVALQNPLDLSWNSLFRGHVADWNYDLEVQQKTGKKAIYFDLELVDALDILADAEVVPDQAGNIVPKESVGDCFYTGQTAHDRILAAIADAATSIFGVVWPSALLNIFSGNVYCQGTAYPARTSILQVIQDAADAEFPGVANFFASKAGVLTFHGRYARFNPANYATYGINTWKAGDLQAFQGDNTIAPIAGITFTRGKTNLLNGVLATPNGIAQTDIAGQLVSDSTSISTYGPRVTSFENLVTEGGIADGLNALQETKQYGTYYVGTYKNPRTRVSQIVFKNPANSSTATPLWPLICGVEISDVVTLTTTHPGGGGFNEDFYVEGITYDIVPMRSTAPEITLTLDVSPKSYYIPSIFS